MDHVLAFDIGGTNIRAAIADAQSDLLAQASVPTVKYDGQRDYGDTFVQLRDGLLTQSGVDPAHLRAVGVAVAGIVDPKTGGIVMAPNISNRSDPSLRSRAGFDLRSILADALGLDVLMENDVNLAAVGEHWRGAAQGCDNFIFAAIGTGIGAGMFIDGRLYRGAHNAAGRLGHLYVHGLEAAGTDGLGALERRAAGPAIASTAVSHLQAPEDIWTAASKGASKGETPKALDDVLDTLALGLANTAMLLDPELIVLGGGVSRAGDAMLIPLRERLSSLVMRPVAPRLELSRLGSSAQLYGAVRCALLRET